MKPIVDMKILLLLILVFYPFSAAIAACENFKIEGVKVLDWLDDDVPYDDIGFDETSWKKSHLEVPLQETPLASSNYLMGNDLVKIENSTVESLMNTDLIKLPGRGESAYLVAGLIYNYNGMLSVYWDSAKRTIHITHGSFHLNVKLSKAEIKKRIRYQPIIVYLDAEPERVNTSFVAGSGSALRSLCDAKLNVTNNNIAIGWLDKDRANTGEDEIPFYEVPSRYIKGAARDLYKGRYLKESLNNDVVAYAGDHYKSEENKQAYLIRGIYWRGSGRFLVYWDANTRHLNVLHFTPYNRVKLDFLRKKTKKEHMDDFKIQPLVVNLETKPKKVRVGVVGLGSIALDYLETL